MPGLKTALSNYIASGHGKKTVEGPPYIAPVEGGYHEILQYLDKYARKNDCFVLGYGGLLNLELLASGKFQGAILADINQRQIAFWEDFLPRVAAHESRKSFLNSYAPEDLVRDYAACTEYSWLNDDMKYKHVREAILNGNVVAISLDMFDVNAHKQLSNALRKAHIKIGLLNCTNILSDDVKKTTTGFWDERLADTATTDALNNMVALSDADTYILDSSRLMPVSDLPGDIASLVETCSAFKKLPEYLADHRPGYHLPRSR